MARKSRVDPDLSMDQIMRAWPQTIPVILDNRMFCVGCPIAEFHTITDACAEHGIDEAEFTAQLDAVVGEEVEAGD